MALNGYALVNIKARHSESVAENFHRCQPDARPRSSRRSSRPTGARAAACPSIEEGRLGTCPKRLYGAYIFQIARSRKSEDKSKYLISLVSAMGFEPMTP